MVAALLALMLVGAVAFVVFGIERARPRPPSVVLVVLDTLRADRVDARTMPFLDAFAREGLRFTAARAPANWTLPSHASLFTGLLPSEHGCHFEHRYLHAPLPTIAEVLRDQGYATAGFSANVNVGALFALDQGFDEFHESWRDDEVRRGAHASDVLARRLLEFLDAAEQRGASRRFAFLNWMDAHLPYDAAPGFERHFGARGAELPRAELAAPDFFDRVVTGERPLDEAFVAALRERYDNAVRGLDARLEALVGELRARRFFEHGILIVSSDHGENLGEHGLVDHQGSLHETVLRVPLVIVGAGVPRAEVDHVYPLQDLFRWLQDAVRSGPSVPGAGRAALAERMVPVEVLERMASSRPAWNPRRLALRARALVAKSAAPDAKLIVHEGEEPALVSLPDDAPRQDPAALAALAAELSRVLSQRRQAREHALPDEASVANAGEAFARLQALGYLAGPPPAASIHAEEHLARGDRALRAGDAARARVEYEAALRIRADHAGAWYALAETLEHVEPAAAPAAWARYLEAASRAGGEPPERLQRARTRSGAR